MSQEFLLQLLSIIAVGGGTYGAIKADLARAIAKAEMAEKMANKAHERIDDLFTTRRAKA